MKNSKPSHPNKEEKIKRHSSQKLIDMRKSTPIDIKNLPKVPSSAGKKEARLHFQVVEIRNLRTESDNTCDSYCTICFNHTNLRTSTIPDDCNPKWPKEEVKVMPLPPVLDRQKEGLVIKVYNEKLFFFDMFPPPASSSNTTSSRTSNNNKSYAAALRRPSLYCADELLGFVQIHLSILCDKEHPAKDSWYTLNGADTGEIRIVSFYIDNVDCLPRGCKTAEEYIVRQTQCILESRTNNREISNNNLTDHYGFRVPSEFQLEWNHLKSYTTCREQRQVEKWDKLLSKVGLLDYKSIQNCKNMSRNKTQLINLVHDGIPRHLRESVYMHLSGSNSALEKKQSVDAKYYENLLLESEGLDSKNIRQIDLDIDRTFGHSKSKIATKQGRNSLRKVLVAYSLRNPQVGYCQGLNFIVGFLLLILEEENTFWMLCVICEDFYPGYYTPTMFDTQTDMLVLKELIAEELPQLDEHSMDIGVPLELLGSQWLLCLFTTTFPTETVLRVFDCILVEGSWFLFAVILAHLRREESSLLQLQDFQTLVNFLKKKESQCLDPDMLIQAALKETINLERLESLRVQLRITVTDEIQRAQRVRTLQRQLAIVQQIPAFSSYAVQMLRFFHKEAEMSTRNDVAFFLTLLCHGLVWLAEHSSRKDKEQNMTSNSKD